MCKNRCTINVFDFRSFTSVADWNLYKTENRLNVETTAADITWRPLGRRFLVGLRKLPDPFLIRCHICWVRPVYKGCQAENVCFLWLWWAPNDFANRSDSLITRFQLSWYVIDWSIRQKMKSTQNCKQRSFRSNLCEMVITHNSFRSEKPSLPKFRFSALKESKVSLWATKSPKLSLSKMYFHQLWCKNNYMYQFDSICRKLLLLHSAPTADWLV